MRQLDAASLDAIKQREGCKLTAYRDTGGTLTIGYGDTNNATEGQTITQEEADARLLYRLQEFEDCVSTWVHVPLSDNQYGALVSFCYNIGTHAFIESTLLKKLNANDYESVPTEMLKWVNVHGVRDPGLVNRRNSEGGQWVKGAYVRGAQITPDKPPAWHNNPVVRKLGGAVLAGAGSVSLQSVKSAADAAKEAAAMWHGFAVVAGVLTGVFVVWALFDHHKANS